MLEVVKLREYIAGTGKPVLEYVGEAGYEDAYAEFYDKLLDK